MTRLSFLPPTPALRPRRSRLEMRDIAQTAIDCFAVFSALLLVTVTGAAIAFSVFILLCVRC